MCTLNNNNNKLQIRQTISCRIANKLKNIYIKKKTKRKALSFFLKFHYYSKLLRLNGISFMWKKFISNSRYRMIPSKPRFLLYVSSRPVNTRWRQVQNSKLIRARNDLHDDITIIY